MAPIAETLNGQIHIKGNVSSSTQVDGRTGAIQETVTLENMNNKPFLELNGKTGLLSLKGDRNGTVNGRDIEVGCDPNAEIQISQAEDTT